VVLVSVLFGSSLLGVIGALIAIPAAASIQIVIREWVDYRRMLGTPTDLPPTAGEEPFPA
jgi:predicted PurR-regulated permease PerM